MVPAVQAHRPKGIAPSNGGAKASISDIYGGQEVYTFTESGLLQIFAHDFDPLMAPRYDLSNVGGKGGSDDGRNESDSLRYYPSAITDSMDLFNVTGEEAFFFSPVASAFKVIFIYSV